MMLPEALVHQLREARRRIPGPLWNELIEVLQKVDGYPKSQVIGFIRTQVSNPDSAWVLSEALDAMNGEHWASVATAMGVVDFYANQERKYTEFIWSGPTNGRFPVRRIDQVLYDLISDAKRTILLVAFAAYKVQHLNEHLKDAMKRGVRVTMLLESEEGSEGQLSADGLRAFRDLNLGAVKLLHWPTEKRERNALGRPGKLHAKAAVIDETALISSANFTDDAFNRNMELGVLLRDPSEVAHLLRHFEELERWGTLVEVDSNM